MVFSSITINKGLKLFKSSQPFFYIITVEKNHLPAIYFLCLLSNKNFFLYFFSGALTFFITFLCQDKKVKYPG